MIIIVILNCCKVVFNCGQRKDEREKINKKEKEKRKLTLKMVVKVRKKNLVRKNFFIGFFGAAFLRLIFFFGRRI